AVDRGPVGELLAKDCAFLVPAGQDGREPDLVAAVQALRAVADDPQAAVDLGRLGRAELRRSHATEVVGEQLRARVEHAYHTWRARRSVQRSQQNGDPLRPLRSARHVLLREPDVGVGHKIPMAPALRKAVLRVLNHYDAHLRTVLGTLMDGVERTAEELVRRQDAIPLSGVGADADLLADRLDRLTDRAGQLDSQLTAVDDGLRRARSDLAGQAHRIGEREDAAGAEATKRGKQVEALADRLDRLTAA